MPKEGGHESDRGSSSIYRSPAVDSSREHLNGEPERRISSVPTWSSPTPIGHAPSTTIGIPTSVGPPVTASDDVELGPLGLEPDPADDATQEETFFAVPGGPGVKNDHEEDGNDPNAFFHPATKEPQRILWLPRDELGLCEAEIEANASAGVESTHRYAILNVKVSWESVRYWSLSRCSC